MRRWLYALLLIVALHALSRVYARELYALHLWAWFAVRDEPKRQEPFRWFLHAYDQRKANERDD